MRLLLIAIASVILFFPLYWILHPVFGANWGAGIAAFMMYIGLPNLFLFKWYKRGTNPIIKACNYLLAVIVIGLLCWVVYRALFEGAPWPNSLGLFVMYFSSAIYFIKNGYMPYQEDEMEAKMSLKTHKKE